MDDDYSEFGQTNIHFEADVDYRSIEEVIKKHVGLESEISPEKPLVIFSNFSSIVGLKSVGIAISRENKIKADFSISFFTSELPKTEPPDFEDSVIIKSNEKEVNGILTDVTPYFHNTGFYGEAKLLFNKNKYVSNIGLPYDETPSFFDQPDIGDVSIQGMKFKFTDSPIGLDSIIVSIEEDAIYVNIKAFIPINEPDVLINFIFKEFKNIANIFVKEEDNGKKRD